LFALLVKETEQVVEKDEIHICHRLGLVELVNSEEIKFTTETKGFQRSTMIGKEFQAQIQIPPKNY